MSVAEAEGCVVGVMVAAGAFGVAVGRWKPGSDPLGPSAVDVLGARLDRRPRMEARALLPLVDAVLGDAGVERGQVDLIACSRGPGAFTGVRISLGVAQGLGLGLGVPVVPVCSLRHLAQTARRVQGSTQVLAAFDARMGEVYWRLLLDDPATGLMVGLGPARLDAPEAVRIDTPGPWTGVGDGCCLLSLPPGQLLQSVDTDPAPRPEDLLVLAVAAREKAVPAAEAAPQYLRQRVAEVPATLAADPGEARRVNVS